MPIAIIRRRRNATSYVLRRGNDHRIMSEKIFKGVEV